MILRTIYLLLILCSGLSSCLLQRQEAYDDVDAQVEALKEYYKKAKGSTGRARAKYEKLFFKAFPSSFARYRAIYGVYTDHSEPHPGMREEYGHTQFFFHELKHISKKSFYNKCIDISIGGCWEEANGGTEMYMKLFEDIKGVVPLLAKRTREEIKSVFRHMYDGPHPDHPDHVHSYEILYDKVKDVDPDMAQLMKEAFEQLLSENHCCGH